MFDTDCLLIFQLLKAESTIIRRVAWDPRSCGHLFLQLSCTYVRVATFLGCQVRRGESLLSHVSHGCHARGLFRGRLTAVSCQVTSGVNAKGYLLRDTRFDQGTETSVSAHWRTIWIHMLLESSVRILLLCIKALHWTGDVFLACSCLTSGFLPSIVVHHGCFVIHHFTLLRK